MARITGRNARLYLAIASNGTAEPIASIKAFEFNGATSFNDATCFGDGNTVQLPGVPGGSGSYTGVFDTTVNPTFSASQDGQARKWYFYWDIVGDPTHYFFGTGYFDFSSKFDPNNAEVSGNWSAASTIYKQ